MEYTVKSLANIAGISSRTLRYYDEINLLVPKRINSSGYRIYGEDEVKTLQQIMLYKEMGLPLEMIREFITDKNFNEMDALKNHRKRLLKEQERVKDLINNVEASILSLQGGDFMNNEKRFKGFKKDLLEKNEKSYGKEIREKYGEDTIKKSNERFMGLSEEDFNEANKLSKDINKALLSAMKTNNPSSEEAKIAVQLHKKWLSFYGEYSNEAHVGLGEMYAYDERFKKYYDKGVKEGAAEFLRDSIKEYYK